MKRFERILEKNNHLEKYPFNGFGTSVTYESLFENDYIVKVWAEEEAERLIDSIYSSRPRRLEQNIGAIAKSKDNNYWVIIGEPENEYTTTCSLLGYKYLPPLARFDSGITNKMK